MCEFLNSNLFQTIVLIVTAVITVWIFFYRKHKEKCNAVTVLMLQIKEIEHNIEYLLSEWGTNTTINETNMHYSTIVYEENQWTKYSHLIVGEVSQLAFEQIDNFFKVACRVREQQIYIKQKIHQAIDFKAMHYYNATYGKLNESQTLEDNQKRVEQVQQLYGNIKVLHYIQTEFALGLKKNLKQYHKLTDGMAYAELQKIKRPFIYTLLKPHLRKHY